MKAANICYMIAATATAMIGYHIHGSVFGAICDWFFWPITWVKWLVLHQVTLSIIKATFTWFFQ